MPKRCAFEPATSRAMPPLKLPTQPANFLALTTTRLGRERRYASSPEGRALLTCRFAIS